MPDNDRPLPNTGDPSQENPTVEGSAPPPRPSGPRDEDSQLGASSDDDERSRDGKRDRGPS